MITSYWNDLQYLQSVCKRVPNFLDTIHSNNGFPLLRRELPNGTYHLASPPGFLSPSTTIDFIQLVLDIVQNYKKLENAKSLVMLDFYIYMKMQVFRSMKCLQDRFI